MRATDDWRRWRRKVHDILEVGGDANPAGRLVNAFIVTLIVLNAVAFAAETVDALARALRRVFLGLQCVLGDRLQHRISVASVERGGNPDAEPDAALAGAAAFRVAADHADRLVRRAAVLFQLAGAGRSQGPSGASPVPPAQAGALLAGLADARPRARRRVPGAARRAARHPGAAAVRLHRGCISWSAARSPTNSARSRPPPGGRSPR